MTTVSALPAPITQVVLKDGRMGVIRESRTSIKHCRMFGLSLAFVPDGDGGREVISAHSISRIL